MDLLLARRCLGVLGAGILSLPPAFAQTYTVLDLGTLGGSTSTALGIDEAGTIVGYATDASSVKHAARWDAGGVLDLGAPAGFIVSSAVAGNELGQVAANGEGNPQAIQAYRWEGGVWSPLGTLPGRSESMAAGIDASGRIAGSSFTLGAGDDRGFLWDSGVLTDLGTLGGATRAQGLNDFGQVVGSSLADLGDGTQATRAFLWRAGVMAGLGVLPGEEYGQALGINRLGEAAGSSWHLTSPGFLADHRATLWRDRGATILDLGSTPGPEVCVAGLPAYTSNTARAVNDCRQVVGDARCVSSGAPLAAFLWEDGVMRNLNDLIPAGSGWDLRSARAINNAGQIVGYGIAPDGELHGYLLEPMSPRPCGPLDLEVRAASLEWSAAAPAQGYDVVRGDLEALHAAAGDFAAATTGCVADDVPTTSVPETQDPAVGQGFWLLVRAVGVASVGTYDAVGPGQVASRDAGIGASPASCS